MENDKLLSSKYDDFWWLLQHYLWKQILFGVPKEIKSIKNLKQSSAGYTQQCTVNKPIRVYHVFCQVQSKLPYITMK